MVVDAAGGFPLGDRVRPRRVASFEIEEEIGRGGMGIVYRALDLKLGREVALKRPREDAAERPGFLKRFMTEARLASQLMHPHITTVFEVFEEDGVPWMVMELVDGASLRSMLAHATPLPFEDVLRYAEGLTDALRVAHLGGVLHRDVNPNNILVGKDGRARLSDFGLARAWEDPGGGSDASEDTTQSEQRESVAGTRGYVSPEQVLGEPAGPRSDIFSLGAVLYEMCTGRAAFYRGDPEKWMDLLLHREPEPISEVNSDIPVEFESIVRKAVAKRPFQRYQSANEMLLDIRTLQRRLQSDSDHSRPDPLPRPIPRPVLFVGAGIVVAAVAAYVVLKVIFPPPGTHSAKDWKPRRVTAAPGWEAEPSISPDGSLIAFSSNQSGNSDIWLIDVKGGTPLRLTYDPASDHSPTWFPGGSELAFASDRGGGWGIWKVPRLGGDPVQILPTGIDPTVSPDGRTIAFAVDPGSGLSRIALADTADPTSTKLLTSDEDGVMNHLEPAWSPDGKYICYSDFRDLWLVSVKGGPARRLTTEQAWDRGPAWSGDGRFIYFTSGKAGTQAIWRIPSKGGEAQRMTTGTGPEVSPSLSRDGSRLVHSTYTENLDLVVLDRISGRRREIPGSTFQSLPAIAPDGSAVAYSALNGAQYDLWLQPIASEGERPRPRRLTDHPVTVAMPTFSPDGSWIAFFGALEQQRDVWVVPVSGGVPSRITDDPAADAHPAFSPDGSLLAFSSMRIDGSPHIFVAQVQEGRRVGEARPVTYGTGSDRFPSWSPDGSSLAFVRSAGGESEVWVTELPPGSVPLQATHGADARYVRWDPLLGGLLVSGGWGTGAVELRNVNAPQSVSGAAESIQNSVDFGDEDTVGLFSLSADGRLLAFYQTTFDGDVWVYEIESN